MKNRQNKIKKKIKQGLFKGSKKHKTQSRDRKAKDSEKPLSPAFFVCKPAKLQCHNKREKKGKAVEKGIGFNIYVLCYVKGIKGRKDQST